MSVTLTQRRPSLQSNQKPVVSAPVKGLDVYGNEYVAPTFTIKEVLDAIPAECYKRSLLKSFGFVARDLFFVGLFGYVAASYIHVIPWLSLRVLAWCAYSIVQGLFGTGVWIMAHECGHGAFSDYKSVNDTVGWILHSSLLVPYHSWRLSHSKHHKATGHLSKDTVFVPRDKDAFFSLRGLANNSEDAPITTLYYILLQQLFGWPSYLIRNATGQKYEGISKWRRNHFHPQSPLFEPRDAKNIIISDIGLAIMSIVLYTAIQNFGFSTVFLMYFAPYLWVNHWLVHITYLQHSDPKLPHYTASEWNFARGAAATMDRQFGFIGRYILHDITETHVLHHFVSRIPFYNSRPASEAIKKVLGPHYFRSEDNFITSLYRVSRACQYVDGDNGLKMYRNVNNIGFPHDGKRLDE